MKGEFYTSRATAKLEKLNRLHKKLARMKKHRHFLNLREQILLQFISNQDLVLLALAKAAQARTAAAAAAAGDAAPHRLPACCQSYVGHLVATADKSKLDIVLSMSPADWSELFVHSWGQLVQLLELADRPDNSDEPADDAFQVAVSGSHHHLNHQGPGPPCEKPFLPPPGFDLGAPARLHLQQLERVVDNNVLLSMLALIHHPLPLCYAAGTNSCTRQPEAAPPSHWLSVAQRLQLTQEQLQLFAAAMHEFHRLRGSALGEARQLASRLAGLSLVVQTAEKDRSQSSGSGTSQQSCSTGGSGSSGGSQPGIDEAGVAMPVADQLPTELRPSEAELLDRNLRFRTMYSQLFHAFVCNTLSRVQVARMWAASMPFIPIPSAIIAAAAAMAEQPQPQQQQQLFGGRAGLCHQQDVCLRTAYVRAQQQTWLRSLNEVLQCKAAAEGDACN